MARAQKTILVLYYTRGVYPLRNTIESHLYCWKRYSKHRTIYVNVALGFPWETLKNLDIDVIIFHTSFCGMRWSRRVFYNFTAFTQIIAEHPALKIAIPQDEFIHTDMLCELCEMMSVNVILTCAYENEWETIYGSLDLNNVKCKTVLTGYLDEAVVRRISKYQKPLDQRTIDISYRAWRAAYWLGEHATYKVRVGEVFLEAGSHRGLNMDISLNDGDTFVGDAWFKFLADSRATVGVEGGASILDHDGKLKEKVDAYVAEHPDADFVQTRDACFPGRDNNFSLACISPRHLEAVATKTCQILVKGGFNDILIADEHYISVDKDLSNIDEALDKLSDTDYVQEMIDRSYEEVVAPNEYTYRGFVEEIEREIIDPVEAPKNRRFKGRAGIQRLNAKDWVNWKIIQAEVSNSENPSKYKRLKKVAKPVYKALVDLPKF